MKKLNLYSSLKYKRKSTIESIIYSSVHWCVKQWGVNNSKSTLLNINIDWDPYENNGEYDFKHNEICIFPKAHKNLRDLVDTVIHEYTHHLQKESTYWKLYKKYTYDDHPYEVEANSVAKKYRKECWYSIKDSI